MRLLHYRRRPVKWPAPRNHYDRRRCPECAATIHEWDGQNGHEDYHITMNEWLDRLNKWAGEVNKRVGITEDGFPDRGWSWGAQITGTEDEIEAAE